MKTVSFDNFEEYILIVDPREGNLFLCFSNSKFQTAARKLNQYWHELNPVYITILNPDFPRTDRACFRKHLSLVFFFFRGTRAWIEFLQSIFFESVNKNEFDFNSRTRGWFVSDDFSRITCAENKGIENEGDRCVISFKGGKLVKSNCERWSCTRGRMSRV